MVQTLESTDGLLTLPDVKEQWRKTVVMNSSGSKLTTV